MTEQERINRFKRLLAQAMSETGVEMQAVIHTKDRGDTSVSEARIEIRCLIEWEPPQQQFWQDEVKEKKGDIE